VKRIRPQFDASGSTVYGFDSVDLVTGKTDSFESLELAFKSEAAGEEISAHMTEWVDRGWQDCLALLAATRHRRSETALVEGGGNWRDGEESPRVDDICLPDAALESRVPAVGEVLASRKSHFGNFPARAIGISQFSWFVRTGFRRLRERQLASGVSSALRVFVAAYGLGFAPTSFFRLNLDSFRLRRVGEEALSRAEVSSAMVGQRGALSAAATFFLVARFDCAQRGSRQGDHGLLSLYLEAGRTIQEAKLAATAAGLRTHISPAVRDTQILQLLNLPGDEHQVLHTLTVG